MTPSLYKYQGQDFLGSVGVADEYCQLNVDFFVTHTNVSVGETLHTGGEMPLLLPWGVWVFLQWLL